MRRTQSHPEQRTRPLWGRFLVLVMLVLGCVFGWGLLGCAPEEPVLVISEVVSSNKLSYPDEELGSPDWIELHNLSDREVDLKGFILTDKQDSYERENMLPSVKVPANGYAVFYAKTDAKTDTFVLPFGLSKGGDTLCLLNASGTLLEQLDIPARRA